MMFTRQEYLKSKDPNAHRTYYGQFVNPNTIARVVNAIGKERLLKSTNPHFNDIPLAKWDLLVPALPGSGGFTKAGDFYTLRGGVCLAKEAARQFVESIKGD
jgi:hypothetical protein